MGQLSNTTCIKGAITRPNPNPVTDNVNVSSGSLTFTDQVPAYNIPTPTNISPITVRTLILIKLNNAPPITAPTGMKIVSLSNHRAPILGFLPITVLASSGTVTKMIINAVPTSTWVIIALITAEDLKR